MSTSGDVMEWLLEGDPAVRWQAMRDLQDADPERFTAERASIATEGWGAALLALQEPSGRWGGGIYSPKWTSTHYTTLLLRRLGLMPGHPQALKACQVLLDAGFHHDGGINVSVTKKMSETCVTGMTLSMLAYFRFEDERVEQIVAHLLGQQMPDGGWNCEAYAGATHSSFHTTICVLEGLLTYERWKPANGAAIREARGRAHEFLLIHRLYRSDRTGEIFDPRMTRFSFPPRWHYDIMRALDYLQACRALRDERMEDAIAIIKAKQRKDGRWPLQNRHAGRTYFEMEKPGRPSRWNTLRALRVLRWWEGDRGATRSE